MEAVAIGAHGSGSAPPRGGSHHGVDSDIYQSSYDAHDTAPDGDYFDSANDLSDQFKRVGVSADDSNVPSYLMPTVSSTLPPYQHGENERIRNSYRSATCWTIKKLPNRLEAGTVQSQRKKQTVENLLQSDRFVFKPSSRLKGHVFHPHQHITMNYEKASYINKHVVEEEKVRTDSYSRKHFVVSSRIRFKFEDIFDNPNFVFPNMGPGGGNSDIASIMRSDTSAAASKRFAGHYNEEEGRLTHECQLQIQDWSRRIFKQLERDWSGLTFRIRFTKSQELLIQFMNPYDGRGDVDGSASKAPFPPPNNALLRYMQHFARHGIGMELKLQKRGDRWNTLEYDPGHTPSNTGETWASLGDAADGPAGMPIPSGQTTAGPAGGPTQGSGVSVSDEEAGHQWFVPGEVAGIPLPGIPLLRPLKQRPGSATGSEPEVPSSNRSRPSSGASTGSGGSADIPLTPLGLPQPHANRKVFNSPGLEPTLEEASHGSDSREQPLSTQQTSTGRQFLTFSLYAPWVTTRQVETSKKMALRERERARAYAEQRARLYNPERADRVYGSRLPRGGDDVTASPAQATDDTVSASRVNSINPTNSMSLSILAAVNSVREGNLLRSSLMDAGGNSRASSFAASSPRAGGGVSPANRQGQSQLPGQGQGQGLSPSQAQGQNQGRSGVAMATRVSINGSPVAMAVPIRHISRMFSNIDMEYR